MAVVTMDFRVHDQDRRLKESNGSSGNLFGLFLTFVLEEFSDFSGLNATFGFLWTVTPRITLGGVLELPYKAEVRYQQEIIDCAADPHNHLFYEDDLTIDFPLSFGFGIVYRFSDALWLTGDFTRVEWDEFVLTDGSGNRSSPITAELVKKSDVDPTHTVRLGGEYLFIGEKIAIPLRLGVFYDPEPSESHPKDFFGFSVGTGVSVGNLSFDLAYQFRSGQALTHATAGYMVTFPDEAFDVCQHYALMSMIIAFP